MAGEASMPITNPRRRCRASSAVIFPSPQPVSKSPSSPRKGSLAINSVAHSSWAEEFLA